MRININCKYLISTKIYKNIQLSTYINAYKYKKIYIQGFRCLIIYLVIEYK